jgi:hypothetical protein
MKKYPVIWHADPTGPAVADYLNREMAKPGPDTRTFLRGKIAYATGLHRDAVGRVLRQIDGNEDAVTIQKI